MIQATLAYTAKVVSPNHIGNLASLMASIALDYDELPTLGASLVSDTTAAASKTVTRTLVVSFFAIPNFYPVTDHAEQPASIEGSVDLTTLIYGGSGSLNGQTLILDYSGSGAEVAMMFGAPVSPADAIAEINAAFNPNVIASQDSVTNELILTTLAEGPSASLAIIVGGTAVSTLGLTATIPPTYAYGIAANPFRGTIESSSPNDAANGSGLQLVRINYIDPKGNGGFEDAEMNGTTPVILSMSDKTTITSIVPITGTPVGLITIYTGDPTKVVRSFATGRFLSPGTPTQTFNSGYACGDCAGQILNDFTGTIISTSNNDGPSGSGATTVTIDYLDALGNPHSQVVSLNGQTSVVLPTSDHATITAITPNVPNTGIITIYTGDDTISAGAPAATLPASFVANFPNGTDQTAPFWDLYTHTLANGLGSVVSAAAPVLS
jgi:hypothetical protein